jgi:hypothetical protein
MRVNADEAGRDYDLSSGRGILAHEMNGELDTVDDSGVEDIDDRRVGFRRDPIMIGTSVSPPRIASLCLGKISRAIRSRLTLPSHGDSRYIRNSYL